MARFQNQEQLDQFFLQCTNDYSLWYLKALSNYVAIGVNWNQHIFEVILLVQHDVFLVALLNPFLCGSSTQYEYKVLALYQAYQVEKQELS